MLVRIAQGHFTRAELRRYLVAMAGSFWGCILLAWISYPADHHYSIMSHTFSFLGSYSPEHNPRWWWIFSAAMMLWAVLMLPLVQYHYRRFAAVSRWGARVGAGLFLLGSVGTAIVALYPDATDRVLGGFRSTDVHEKGAVLVAIGFTEGTEVNEAQCNLAAEKVLALTQVESSDRARTMLLESLTESMRSLPAIS